MVHKKKFIIEKISNKVIESIGTPKSIFIHTIFFISIFILLLFGWTLNQVLLLLTTILSIEAIYLALFIQMTVNKANESIEDVEKDIDDIQAEEKEDEIHEKSVSRTLATIEKQLIKLQNDIDGLKKKG